MEISSNKKTYEGSKALGNFAEQREKILKEVALDPDKMDGFMKAGPKDEGDTKILLNLGKLKKSLINKSGRDSQDKPDASEKTEITLNLGNARKLVDKVLKKGKTVSSLDMDGYMIPQNEGKIKHMSLTYCSGAGGSKANYVEAMKTFLAKMPSAKFTILTSSASEVKEAQKYVDEWAKEGIIENPERIKIINSGVRLSVWAQDSTLVQGNKVIEQDRMWFPGSGDGAVAGEISKANPELKYERMEGRFVDGGNQIPTMDRLYVGSDAIAFMIKDMKVHPKKYDTVKNELKIDSSKSIGQEELCKLMLDKTFPHQQVVIVGYKGEQPAFHIDMALTPLGKLDPDTGKQVITVGDPSMALKVLKDIEQKEPEKYIEYEKAIRSKVDYSPPHPLDTLVDTLSTDTALQENFDSIAKGLEADGFKIERVPYLGSSSLRSTPWITYNNSVIDGDNIFIPNFGIPELDDMGNGVYKKYGYTPVPIDMTAISSLMGAINCITKVMEREYTT